MSGDEQGTGSSGTPASKSFSKPVEAAKEYSVDIIGTGK
jgi:hypothetical protein